MKSTKTQSKLKNLSLRAWWDEVGTDNVKKLAAELDISISYMRLLRYRLKRSSPDRAFAIIEAAKRLTPGFVPDLEQLIAPLPNKTPNPNYTAVIQPSKAFLASLKR